MVEMYAKRRPLVLARVKPRAKPRQREQDVERENRRRDKMTSHDISAQRVRVSNPKNGTPTLHMIMTVLM